MITQSESQMLGMHIQGIQRDMGTVRETCVNQPQILEQVKVIDNKQAKASKTQKMLHAETVKIAE